MVLKNCFKFKSFESILNQSISLNDLVNNLEKQVLNLGTSYSDTVQTKYQEATQILANIDNRTNLVQKKAERITEETQTLLDTASNALENLNKINKTLSGIAHCLPIEII